MGGNISVVSFDGKRKEDIHTNITMIDLPGTWRTIQQNTLEWFAVTSKELWEPGWHDDSLQKRELSEVSNKHDWIIETRTGSNLTAKNVPP